MRISKFAVLFLVVFGAMLILTWDEFKFVVSCTFQDDSKYMNEHVVDIIDEELKPGVSLHRVQELFRHDIPGGEMIEKSCVEDSEKNVLCGEGFYQAKYPFGIHDCICGRPNRIFTLEFDRSNELKSLNYIDRKICA